MPPKATKGPKTMYSYQRTAAVPALFPKMEALADKAVKTSIKLFQGLAAAEDGVKKVDDILRSIRSMYGGGFLSGKPTEIDATFTEINQRMRAYTEAVTTARTHANEITHLLKKLTLQFQGKS